MAHGHLSASIVIVKTYAASLISIRHYVVGIDPNT